MSFDEILKLIKFGLDFWARIRYDTPRYGEDKRREGSTEMNQAEMYERALNRAHEENLKVTLLESWGAHVVNPKYADGYYTVRFSDKLMSCNCEAGQRAIYCKHRAIVREQLIARKFAGKAIGAPSVEERDPWGSSRISDASFREAYAEQMLKAIEREAEQKQEAAGFLSDPDYQAFVTNSKLTNKYPLSGWC